MTDKRVFPIKAGDTSPGFKVRLGDYQEGSGILNDVLEVEFFAQHKLDPTVVITGTGQVLDVDGIVGYAWTIGDTDVVGDYNAALRVTHADGTKQTSPSDGYYTLSIDPLPGQG